MKILLAYDSFDYSRYALEETAKLAEDEGTEITVLSVVPPDARASKSGGHVGMRPHANEDIAIADAYLRERGIEPETKIAYGEPADEIVAAAEEGGFDLIVVGSRGLGAVRGILLGSVSRKVVANSPCPVLVANEHVAERVSPRQDSAV